MKRYKILLLGNSGVGKSSLICRWTLDQFNASLLGTVGVDFKAKKVSIGSENYHIQVWDTAGQEQFHKITTSYYKGANGIMLVYDVTDLKSAEEVSYWMKNIKSHAADDVAVVMVGNKVDLLREGTGDSSILTTGKNSGKKYGVPHYMTSAKDSTGVDDAFLNLVKLIVNSDDSGPSYKPPGGAHLPPNSGSQPAHRLNPAITEKTSSISSIFRGKKKAKDSSPPPPTTDGLSGGGSSGGNNDLRGGNDTSGGGKNGKEKCVIC